MRIFNTQSKTVQDFVAIHPPEVSVYTCGPTVYDYPHIGNWFTFVRYDLLVRALINNGFNPKWIMNITDVGHLVSDADEGEDKLEKGARREGKTAWDIAQFYTEYFQKGLKDLNITAISALPRATDHIKEQIDLIKVLGKKGYTYKINDGVYFDSAKFKDYGKMAHLDIPNLKAGVRVEANPKKRQAHDFALWKFSPKSHQRDMEWDSPWGKGFPGWHLECSAMAMKYLGKTIDIHVGGIDHIPVHHTNEIAQSQAATGQKLANYWVHMNHVTVSGQKLAKSSGHTITLETLLKRGYSLAAFRLLVLESHYRTQAEFSWAALAAAQKRLIGYQAFADLRWQVKSKGRQSNIDFKRYWNNILARVSDDLSTPRALAQLSEIVDKTPYITSKSEFITFLEQLDSLFGLKLLGSTDISMQQKEQLRQREKLRQQNQWSAADKIREALSSQGVGLRDTDQGSIWFRL